MQRFTTRLIEELRATAEIFHALPGEDELGAGIDTVFVGGGTPTLLPAADLERLLAAFRQHGLHSEVEFTVEANPETVTRELTHVLTYGGVNRISLGAQSFHPQHLATLERHHRPQSVNRAIALFRDAGIKSINLDLIFGVPGQSLDDWIEDLDQALRLEPDHLSCYSLMYEPNTPLTQKLRLGRIQPVNDDVEATMYEATMDRLGAAGYEQYEISAWAKPGHRCAHNLLYWRNHNWWPLGPSAAGHINGLRWKNIPRLGDYMENSPWPPITDVESPDRERAISETVMLGLRLLEGMCVAELDQLLATSEREEWLRSAIQRHCSAGLLREHAGRLALTREGLLQADTVLVDLI